jgi:hypothetical protein
MKLTRKQKEKLDTILHQAITHMDFKYLVQVIGVIGEENEHLAEPLILDIIMKGLDEIEEVKLKN